MFSEYLDRHPLARVLTDRVDALIPPASDRGAWEGISPDDRRELLDLAARYDKVPYPMRTAGGFLAFVQSGSRQADEGPYFTRRRKLCAAALRCCVTEDAPVDDVIDGVWCICEETGWVISAHNINPIPGAPDPKEYPLPDPDSPYVDLFAAQTAMILSLVRHLMRERLDAVTPMICRRVVREIRRRVITPFMSTDDFWWMGVRRKDLNNWTPWIVSGVMLAACLIPMDRAELAALMDRGCRMLDRWLGCVPQDGGCDEGVGYWNMAGGALLDCLELLEEVTGGRMTFWEDEKIRNILRFPLKAQIGNGWFVNFADCDARPALSGERLQFAGEKLRDPDLSALGESCRGDLDGELSDVPRLDRLLRMLFHHPAPAPKARTPENVWLKDLQVRIVRSGPFTLCAKGGHNGENHNHNDVGSFTLFLDGEPQVVDAGNMVYTARTFSPERYTLWNTRSAYHNLPLIGGHEQLPGEGYAARDVSCLGDGLKLSLKDAYGKDAGILSWERTVTLDENGLTLKDAGALRSPAPVTWVFMLRHRPEWTGGAVLSGGIRISVPEGLDFAAEEIPVTDPRMARSFPGSLWRVTLTGGSGDRIDRVFVITRREPHA